MRPAGDHFPLQRRRELLSPQDGYVIEEPHDDRRLAGCLLELLDPARRMACAQAARRRAGAWTFERHFHQLTGVFQEAALQNRSSADPASCCSTSR